MSSSTVPVINPAPNAKYIPALPVTDILSNDQSKKLLNYINIYHPSYPDTPFVVLPSSDGDGVHYCIAYYACCTIADNIWVEDEGRLSSSQGPFLATSADPADRVVIPPDDILRGKEYYFHVPEYPDPEEPYPLVPNFEHWTFPHEKNVPAPWMSVSTPDADNETRNRNCVYDTDILNEPCHLTGAHTGLNVTHIIPLAQRQWFGANRMTSYIKFYTSKIAINDNSNLISFRSDVHKSLDDKVMMLVPKPVGEEPDRHKLVIHVLQPPTQSARGYVELCNLYQNREVRPLVGIHREFLFARFAYSIFNDFTFPLCKNLKSPILMTVRDGREKVTKYARGSRIPKFSSTSLDTSKTRKRTSSQVSGRTSVASDDREECEDGECDQWAFTAGAVGYGEVGRGTDNSSDDSDSVSSRGRKRVRSDWGTGSDSNSSWDEPNPDMDDEHFYRSKGIVMGKERDEVDTTREEEEEEDHDPDFNLDDEEFYRRKGIDFVKERRDVSIIRNAGPTMV
ncbi:hypothetical protein F5Y13DRAFT_176322 [Hypoxylon sp. FL1857]|nr:hypothetical protein F5Y13DRAFT_176322 [Hypoxylon sp. FL1857]